MAELPETARQKLKHWVAGPHPDANLLSAFAENSLSARERGPLVEHLAACASCREVVALAAPQDISAAIAPAPGKTVRQWAMLRWGTAAAILVVMVGVVWLGRSKRTVAPEPAAEVARAMPQSANQMAPEEKAKAEPQGAAPGAESTPASVDDKQAAIARSMEPARPRAGKKEVASDRLEAVRPQSGRKKDEELANAPVVAEAAPAANKARPMSELPSLARTAPSSAAAALDRAEPKTLSAANEQAQVSAAVPAAPAARQAMQAGAAAKARGIARWSIASDGSLQRTLDEGRSWQQELVESGTVFRAVSAVGSEIWAGGNRGVLYHSGDGGGSWARMTPAASGATLSGDIVRINFADAQHGSLTTSSGQTWLTADGGRTWALR